MVQSNLLFYSMDKDLKKIEHKRGLSRWRESDPLFQTQLKVIQEKRKTLLKRKLWSQAVEYLFNLNMSKKYSGTFVNFK